MKYLCLVMVLLILVTMPTVPNIPCQNVEYTFEHYHKLLESRSCPVYGGVLRIAIAGEPSTLNWWVASSSWSRFVLMPIYNRLIRIINGSVYYEVAKRIWWYNRTTLFIEIRTGIRWHDGKPLTAKDVAFTINILARYRWTYLHGYFTSVKIAIPLNETMLMVVFSEPDAGFVLNALARMDILPEHIWKPIFEKLGDAVAKYSPRIDELIGSGPFKIVEYVPGQYIRYHAFKDYWQGRPCVDTLVIIFIKSSSAGLVALQRGDIDAYLGYVAPEAAEKLAKQDPAIKIHKFLSDIVFYWGFNTQKWPFNLTEFRRALAYAINRSRIVELALRGNGVVASLGVVPPIGMNKRWFNPFVVDALPYDPNKAAYLLDRLGFIDIDEDGWREAPNGSEFCINIYVPSYDPARIRVANLIKEYLAKIPNGGVCVEVKVLDWKILWPLIKGGSADSFILGSAPGNDISWLYRRFHCPPQGSANWVRYCNPVVDRLTEELKKVFDSEKRRSIAWRIQMILAKEVPVIALYHRLYVVPYRTDNVDCWYAPRFDWLINWITLLRVHSAKHVDMEKPYLMAYMSLVGLVMLVLILLIKLRRR